jgi:hypothetical protein
LNWERETYILTDRSTFAGSQNSHSVVLEKIMKNLNIQHQLIFSILILTCRNFILDLVTNSKLEDVDPALKPVK